MKAIVIQEFGNPDQLALREIPQPRPKPGDVLVRVRAFGVNRAETYMRRGLWGEVARVSGIECVGEIVEDPSGQYQPGQKVAAVMGGMGRTINGSYAEYSCPPITNVFPLDTDLSWTELAAIPESYATAWSCLHDNLHLQPGNIVFIRGGTSALGQAAINIAAAIDDVTVLASTRNPQRRSLLESLGCDEVLIEQSGLSEILRNQYPHGIDNVMDIVGNTTLLDSLKMVKKGGYVCNAGFLGGGKPFAFDPLTDMLCSINLNFFASFMLGTADFPLSDIPMQTIVDRVSSGIYQAGPVKIFNFEDTVRAHALMESNLVPGKLVIRGTCTDKQPTA